MNLNFSLFCTEFLGRFFSTASQILRRNYQFRTRICSLEKNTAEIFYAQKRGKLSLQKHTTKTPAPTVSITYLSRWWGWVKGVDWQREIRGFSLNHICSLVAATSFGSIAVWAVAARTAAIGPHLRTVRPALASYASAVPTSLRSMGSTRATGSLFVV